MTVYLAAYGDGAAGKRKRESKATVIEWSRKQYALYMMAEHPAHTFAVHGPVRSGKTMAAVYGFGRMACKNFAGHDFAICARSQRQLEAVPMTYLRQFARAHGMTLRSGKDHYVLSVRGCMVLRTDFIH